MVTSRGATSWKSPSNVVLVDGTMTPIRLRTLMARTPWEDATTAPCSSRDATTAPCSSRDATTAPCSSRDATTAPCSSRDATTAPCSSPPRDLRDSRQAPQEVTADAAVHHEVVAVDVARVGSEQKGDDIGDVLRHGHTAQRHQ